MVFRSGKFTYYFYFSSLHPLLSSSLPFSLFSVHTTLNKSCHLPFTLKKKKKSWLSEEITLAKFYPEVILEGQFQTNKFGIIINNWAFFICWTLCLAHILLSHTSLEESTIIISSLSDIISSSLKKNKQRFSLAQEHTAVRDGGSTESKLLDSKHCELNQNTVLHVTWGRARPAKSIVDMRND